VRVTFLKIPYPPDSCFIKKEEKNQEYKFNFMLHADKKAARQWKDLPVPFPESVEKMEDAGGVSQLPNHLRKAVKSRKK